ncbi:Uncharacterized protein OBRU01_18170 [Operophtera brumata]|uniref:Uncharacterized protein n=1 Tax=Operophtera brumata TaxID=104452 RepID=A0A0L7KZD0_OPEBR|nr:Uncharacterized protein OBRU01_18170 [Operophtera brumata]
MWQIKQQATSLIKERQKTTSSPAVSSTNTTAKGNAGHITSALSIISSVRPTSRQAAVIRQAHPTGASSPIASTSYPVGMYIIRQSMKRRMTLLSLWTMPEGLDKWDQDGIYEIILIPLQNTQFKNSMHDIDLKSVTSESVKNVILPMLASDLSNPTKRGLPFAPEIIFQKMDGDVMDICQQSVSRIIAKVSALIASKMKDFVKFLSSVEEINTVKSPGGITSEVYRNRKGWFSINVQAVTGPNLEFYDLVARWPGSTHMITLDECSLLV